MCAADKPQADSSRAEKVSPREKGQWKVDVSLAATAAHKLLDEDVSLVALLSTCIDACERGCAEIRRAHANLDRDHSTLHLRQFDHKIADDPRSALTAADLAAQKAIVCALQREWPNIKIVAEEEDVSCSVASEQQPSRLRRDLCTHLESPDVVAELFSAAPSEITIFVDPLDGTREFVEGRIENVQTLIGIAVAGHSVAGAIGLPFAEVSGKSASEDESGYSTRLVYALEGAGAYSRPPPSRSKIDGVRPLLVAGDSRDPALDAASAAALSSGGQRVLLGGTGQKLLAVAEGRADVSMINFQSKLWDTCASEALVRATGGLVTDLFGERLVYSAEALANSCGVLGSAAGFEQAHLHVCAAMRSNPDALERLRPWGLEESSSHESVFGVLNDRRERLSWRRPRRPPSV